MPGEISFYGRQLLIATRHQKEKVIQPLMESALGVKCSVPDNFGTDIFGTFSGEVERMHDPYTTAKMKCRLAMKKYGADLVIASEGSFGPHPSLFFIPADDELVMMLDAKNNLEFAAREISVSTNFSGREVRNEEELKAFAETVYFPSHGLILRRSKDDKKNITKGIHDWQTLLQCFLQYKQKFHSVFAETDMRAMYNPTRMLVIEKAVAKLISIIQSECPVCRMPGFWIHGSRQGLPCSVCGLPTKSILNVTYQCKKCGHRKEEYYPDNKTAEDPMYCDYCNP